MQIIKYAGKSCVKCKILDKVFSYIKDLPCEVETVYVEDVGEHEFVTKGIDMLPTLAVINGDSEIRLTGAITPAKVQQAIEKVQNV